MPILKELIPKVIPSQKCPVNVDPILRGYTSTGIRSEVQAMFF